MTSKLLKALIAIALIATGSVLVSQYSASTSSSAVQLTQKQVAKLVNTATTAEDHRELAQYYRKEAQRKRQEEKRYEDIAAAYRLHPPRVDTARNVPTADYYQHLADEAGKAALADDQIAAQQGRLADGIAQAK